MKGEDCSKPSIIEFESGGIVFRGKDNYDMSKLDFK